MQYIKDFSLAEFTTWKIGGTADWCARPQTVGDVHAACQWALDKNLPVTVLSGGSNVLISDKGIAGLVLLLDQLVGISEVEFNNEVLSCVCLAGTRKSDLLKVFVKSRLSPAIFLAGLPGDVGGGVVMNAGVGHDVAPKEFVEITEWFEYIPWAKPQTLVRKNKDQIQWTYRHSDGWGPGVIVRVGIQWKEAPQANLLEKLKISNQRRMASQPLQWPSCGSTFKNPPANKAGRLIDECGLKNYSIGGAQVSDLHANFIVNRGHATANDVLALVKHIQETVRSQKNILLEPEFKFLGR